MKKKILLALIQTTFFSSLCAMDPCFVPQEDTQKQADQDDGEEPNMLAALALAAVATAPPTKLTQKKEPKTNCSCCSHSQPSKIIRKSSRARKPSQKVKEMTQ